MKIQRRRTPLEQVPVFEKISPEQKRDIELAGSRRFVGRGKFLFREGDQASGIHVLLSGKLKSSRYLAGGHEIVMHFISPGEVFGEVPAFLGRSYPASAQAVEDSEIFTLPVRAIERLIAREPGIAMRIFRGMSRKLVVLLDRIEAQKGFRAEERITRYLLSHADRKVIESGGTYRLPATKKMWAAELGLQPESLSRSLAG